jgi:hypothetical protein
MAKKLECARQNEMVLELGWKHLDSDADRVLISPEPAPGSDVPKDDLMMGKAVLAWLRRIIVSVGIGGVSYALMLGIMVLSVVYDRAFEPVITFAFDTGRLITNWLDSLVSGTYWGQVAVNHLRERVNMTHVVLSIPAIIIAAIMVGIPLNWLLGGTRTAVQRIAIAVVSVPATLVLAVALFTFNALVPETYAALLRFADWIWQGSLNALSSWGDTIPGALKLTNVARQGFSGHHYVIMALCSMVASFLVNALFAFVTSSRDGLSTAQLAAAVDRRIAVGRYEGEKTIG